MHFYEDQTDNKKLQKMIGKSRLQEAVGAKAEVEDKSEIFEAVDILVSAARDLYFNGDCSWEEVCEELSKGVSRLAKKERTLKALE